MWARVGGHSINKGVEASQLLTFPFHSSSAFAHLFPGKRVERAYLNIHSFVNNYDVHQTLFGAKTVGTRHTQAPVVVEPAFSWERLTVSKYGRKRINCQEVVCAAERTKQERGLSSVGAALLNRVSGRPH